MTNPGRYTLIRGGQRLMWYTERLWELSKDLPVHEVPIDAIPEFEQNCWFQSRLPTLKEVSSHAKRIQDADLSYPVILNDEGGLMDGGHRLCKASALGHSKIRAVQFTELPDPDQIIEGSLVELKTDRLTLREFTSHDLHSLFDLYSRPQTSEFESWDAHTEETESRELLQYWLDASYQNPRTSYSLVVEFEGKLIGLCGLELGFGTETDDLRCGFLGFRLHPDYWRHGLATEAGQAMIEFGFNELKLHRMHAGTVTQNLASIRVLEKLGFCHEGTTRQSFPIGETWRDYMLFGLLHSDDKKG